MALMRWTGCACVAAVMASLAFAAPVFAQNGPPGAPTNLQASASWNVVTVTWGAPSTGGTPTNYVLIARAPGGALLAALNVWPTPSFISNVPNGIYLVSVMASNAAGNGPETAAVQVTVPSQPPPGPGAPGVPTNFQGTVSGNTVSLSWGAPTSGGAVQSYTVIARTTGGAPIATQNVGPTTSFVGAVPNGIYVVSIVASNADGSGPETPSQTFTVPNFGLPPGPPQNLQASAAGTTVTFTWLPPSVGGPVQTYLINAALTPGGVPIATLTIPGTQTSTSVPNVPVGTYYVTALAVNAAGTSAGSNSTSVTVGGIAPGGGSRSTMNPPGVPSIIEGRTSAVFLNGLPQIIVADDFTFAGGSNFTKVQWQGNYCVSQNNASAPGPTAQGFVFTVYGDNNGLPNPSNVIASATLPLSQVNETSQGVFVNATCGNAVNTRWSVYSYSATLPTVVHAAAGVRYWLTIQAILPNWNVDWNWRMGTTDTKSSLQFINGQLIPFNVDRAFALSPQ